MSPIRRYDLPLSDIARLVSRYETRRGELIHYAVALVVMEAGHLHTIRVYDNAHGHAEMHRYNRRGRKQPAESAPGATPSEGFNIALNVVTEGFEEMIEGWRRS